MVFLVFLVFLVFHGGKKGCYFFCDSGVMGLECWEKSSFKIFFVPFIMKTREK